MEFTESIYLSDTISWNIQNGKKRKFRIKKTINESIETFIS